MEFEKLFSPFLLMAKKHYLALKYEWINNKCCVSISDKGNETARRGNFEFVKRCMNEVIEIMMCDMAPTQKYKYKTSAKYIPPAEYGDKKNMIRRVFNVVDEYTCNLRKRIVPINQLIQSKQHNKLLKNEQPCHVLAKKMNARVPGSAPAIGDRMSYVTMQPSGSALLKNCAEDPLYVISNGLYPDINYVFER